jgi:membrane associated rhomboid family serine protease
MSPIFEMRTACKFAAHNFSFILANMIYVYSFGRYIETTLVALEKSRFYTAFIWTS